jgi:PAS domain S-box-containing protein
MLRSLYLREVLEHARSLTRASGAMLESVTPAESLCLGATGSLEHWNEGRSQCRSLVVSQADWAGPLLCNDVELDRRVDGGLCRELGVHRLLAVAAPWRPAGLGVFSVVNGEHAFTDTDAHSLHVLMGLLAATLVDVADEPVRATLAELAESGYQQMLDAIDDLVIVKGPRSRIVWANKAFRRAYGMTNEQLRGIIDSSASEPDYTLKYIRDDRHVFETGETLDIPDDPLRCYDGELRTYHTVKSAIFDADGRVAMTVGVSRDMSERKLAEAELGAYRDQLERLVRERTGELEVAKSIAENANRAKSAFLANMSHELRTPMHAILAYARLGLDRSVEPKLTSFLRRIIESGERLLILLNELLDLSKLEAGRMHIDLVTSDLEQIVRDVMLEIEPFVASKRLVFQLERAPGCDSCMASVDRKLMAQAFHNILANAVRFSPEEGTLGVRFASVELAPSPGADDGHARPALEVAFRDDGVGIPETELESIFDKFVQSSKTRTNAGGTGLGLAITRQIAELHHGDVRARNNATRGATFVMTIPLRQTSAGGRTGRLSIPLAV